MSETPDKWYAVSVTVDERFTEAVESALNNLDSLGSQIDLLSHPLGSARTVTAYFAEPPDAETVRAELNTAATIYGLPNDLDLEIQVSPVESRDWLAEWKKHWRPVEIGRFIVAAPWHEVQAEEKDILIRIEPNMAFGTGTHATTQMCMAAIDANYRGSMSFMDVGTGTGLLAIAAAKMAGHTVGLAAVDTDADAVSIARSNAEANGVGGRIHFETGTIDSITGSFDFVCANLTADVILPLLPVLIERSNTTLVLSGILAEQEDLVRASIPGGLNVSQAASGEWIALIVKK